MAPRAGLKGQRLNEYESNRNQPDLNTTATTNPHGDTATIDKTLRIASSITVSVHHPALSRRTSDSAYAVLLDALHVGSRCYKPEGLRKGACDLCLLLDDCFIPETMRHIAIECPFSALAKKNVLWATLQIMTFDNNMRENDLALTWADLVHEHRRFLIT